VSDRKTFYSVSYVFMGDLPKLEAREFVRIPGGWQLPDGSKRVGGAYMETCGLFDTALGAIRSRAADARWKVACAQEWLAGLERLAAERGGTLP
jgi:hypothetical protein